MDDFTKKHCEDWLRSYFGAEEEDKDRARDALECAFDNDPDFCEGKSYPEILRCLGHDMWRSALEA